MTGKPAETKGAMQSMCHERGPQPHINEWLHARMTEVTHPNTQDRTAIKKLAHATTVDHRMVTVKNVSTESCQPKCINIFQFAWIANTDKCKPMRSWKRFISSQQSMTAYLNDWYKSSPLTREEGHQELSSFYHGRASMHATWEDGAHVKQAGVDDPSATLAGIESWV